MADEVRIHGQAKQELINDDNISLRNTFSSDKIAREISFVQDKIASEIACTGYVQQTVRGY